jgi:hypothetical protein
MATIGTASHASLNNVPRRSYIAMNSYTSDLFSYSLTFNPNTFTNVGFLSNLSVPTTSTLQGSILSETGKKLYPGANDGVDTLMVSVYDQTSKVTGFINPNSPTFALLTTDKPPYMGQGVDPGTDGRSNLGNSIYTHGSVIADGFGTYSGLLSTGQSLTVGTTASIRSSISTGTSATIGTTLSVLQLISCGTTLSVPSTYTNHMFVTAGGDGRTSYTSASIGSTGAGNNSNVGGVGNATVTNISTTAVTADSKVFVTGYGTAVLGGITVNPGVGFVVKSVPSGDGQTINWWVIN